MDPVVDKDIQKKAGIYIPCERDGRIWYIRDPERADDFPFWANVPEIPAKKEDVCRLVLLGESVARGYFFEPEYSCANVLASFLTDQQRPVEVIDLAKSGISFNELLETSLDAFNLQPDLIVIFGGNNLTVRDNILTQADYLEIDELLSHADSTMYHSIRQVVERRFHSIVINFLDSVKAKAVEFKIPAIYVLPEFNLLDWRSATFYDRFTLWPDRNGGSIDHLATEGRNCLRDNRLDALEAIAKRLIEISPLSPMGYEFMGHIELQNGRPQAAKDFFVAAKDSGLCRISVLARCYSVTRNSILEWSNQNSEMSVVDLPAILSQHVEHAIPDRSIFMDYCHLTFEGIKIAMMEVAKKVCDVLNLRIFMEDRLAADPLVMARAHFCAALHCAHYGPQVHLVDHHCQLAVGYHSEAISWMQQYVDIISKSNTWDLNPSYIKLLKSGVASNYEGGTQFTQPHSILDIELSEAMTNALSRFVPGAASIHAETRARYQALREGNASLDLLDSQYVHSSYLSLPSFAYYYEAFEIASRFILPFAAECDVALCIVHRLSKASVGGAVEIIINDVLLEKIDGSTTWRKTTINVPIALLHRGINSVVVRWPVIERSNIKRADQESFTDFVRRCYHPTYGELSTLTAKLPGKIGDQK